MILPHFSQRRFVTAGAAWLLLACCWPFCRGLTADVVASHPTRQQLIGAWRLDHIDLSGPRGRIPDPFYETGSVGMIIYDASGWMSVQISAPRRAPFEVPASRSMSGQPTANGAAKATAFDSYYAYYGTWTLDAETSVLTHVITASLLPAETGRQYSQTVSLDGNRLTFTGHDTVNGENVVRTKVWRRVL